MKVKLNQDIVKKYQFHVGGDMSEDVGIAVSLVTGLPIKYRDLNKTTDPFITFTFHCMDKEFCVTPFENPIPDSLYQKIKGLFVEELK